MTRALNSASIRISPAGRNWHPANMSWTTKKGNHRAGHPWSVGHLYRHHKNRLYLREVQHNGNTYPASPLTSASRKSLLSAVT